MEEFNNIINNFVDQEVNLHGKLSEDMKVIIRTVCFCVLEAEDEILELTKQLIIGDRKRVKEALLQCTPYIGSIKVRKAMKLFDFEDECTKKSIEQRFKEGKEKRSEIFGFEATNKNIDNALEDLKHIQHYLCSYCFGDFYTREGLNLKERELLTFCILSSLGGCESQLKSHVKGNLNVGNTRDDLIDAITVCLPYIGFPKTLNAISCINEITLK